MLEGSGDWPVPGDFADWSAVFANSVGSYHFQSGYQVGPIHSAAKLPAVCCFVKPVAVDR